MTTKMLLQPFFPDSQQRCPISFYVQSAIFRQPALRSMRDYSEDRTNIQDGQSARQVTRLNLLELKQSARSLVLLPALN